MAPECSPSVHSPIVHSPSVHNAYRRAHQRSSEVIRGQQRSSEVFTVRVCTMRTGAPGLFVARSHRTCAARPCASSFLPDEGGNPMVIRRSSSALVISARHQRSSSALVMLTSKEANKFLHNLGLIVRVLIREPREGRYGMNDADIRGHQRPSEAIRGHQRPSAVPDDVDIATGHVPPLILFSLRMASRNRN